MGVPILFQLLPHQNRILARATTSQKVSKTRFPRPPNRASRRDVLKRAREWHPEECQNPRRAARNTTLSCVLGKPAQGGARGAPQSHWLKNRFLHPRAEEAGGNREEKKREGKGREGCQKSYLEAPRNLYACKYTKTKFRIRIRGERGFSPPPSPSDGEDRPRFDHQVRRPRPSSACTICVPPLVPLSHSVHMCGWSHVAKREEHILGASHT